MKQTSKSLVTTLGFLVVAGAIAGAVMVGLFAVTRDVPPVLLYLAPTAFGLAALVRAAARPE